MADPTNNVIEVVIKLVDEISGNLKGISGELEKLRTQVDGAGQTAAVAGGRLDTLRAALARVGVTSIGSAVAIGAVVVAVAAVVGVLALWSAALRKTFTESIESQRATAQLDAAYQSMRGTLGLTRGQLDELTKTMTRTTAASSTAVVEAQSILATFDKVRGQAFERTTKAAADLAARLGIDLTSAVRILGTALQDPERGLNSLRRAGVVFSDAQRELIKTLAETGQAAKAQEIILAELERRIGGSAARNLQTLGGALEQVKNSWDNLFEKSADQTRDTITALHDLNAALQSPEAQRAIGELTSAFDWLASTAVTIGTIGVAKITAFFNAISNGIDRVKAGFTSVQSAMLAFYEGLLHRGTPLTVFERLMFGDEANIAKTVSRLKQLIGVAAGPSKGGLETGFTPVPPPELSEGARKALEAASSEAEKVVEKYKILKDSLRGVLTTFKEGSKEYADAQRALAVLTQKEAKELEAIAAKAREINKSFGERSFASWAAQLAGQAKDAKDTLDDLRTTTEKQRDALTDTIKGLEKFIATFSSLSREERLVLGVDDSQLVRASAAVEKLRKQLSTLPLTQAGAEALEVLRELRSETDVIAEAAAEQQVTLAALLTELAAAPEQNAAAIQGVMRAMVVVSERAQDEIKAVRERTDEVSAAAKRAGEQIQDAFATAVRSLSIGDSFRDIARNFLIAIREIPIQIAAQRIGEKIRKAIEPSLTNIFDGLFGAPKQKPTVSTTTIGAIQRAVTGGLTPAQAQVRARQIVEDIKATAAINDVSAKVEQTTVAVQEQTRALVEAVAANDPCACVSNLADAISSTAQPAADAVNAASADNTAVTKSAGKSIERTISTVGDKQAGLLAGVIRAVNAIKIPSGGGSSFLGDFLKMGFEMMMSPTPTPAAGGGFASGGLMRVGEEGPELVRLPGGARVYNQRQMQFAGSAPQVNYQPVYNIVIEGASDATDTQARLAAYLARRDARLKAEVVGMLKDNGMGRMR